MSKSTGVFGLAMGVVMVIVWVVYIATGNYELGSKPLQAISLLVAELTTASALVVGGLGVVRSRSWGMPLHLASLGMMLYTSIYSVGVFADVLPASAFFVALTAATVAAVLALSRAPAKENSQVPPRAVLRVQERMDHETAE